MKKILFFAVIAIGLAACNDATKQQAHLTKEERIARRDSLKDDLLKTDIAFSRLSEQKGRNAAFLEYADTGATMLREFSQPVTGKDAIGKLLTEFPDNGDTLFWIPVSSDVAMAGDLGYTYGTYMIKTKSAEKFGGTYCTVWRRSKGSNWKFVLSSGNAGVKPLDKTEEKN